MQDPKLWMPKTYSQRFASVAAYGEYLATIPRGEHAKSRGLGENFYGEHTYDQSLTAVREGTGSPALTARVEKLLDGLNFDDVLSRGVTHWAPAMVGHFEIVPNVLCGIPEEMLSRQVSTDTSSRSPVTILVDRAVSASVPTETIEAYGACTAALALTLQRVRPVNLVMVGGLGTYDGRAIVPIVDLGQSPFDPAQVAYTLAHPSFHRRLNFNWYHKDGRGDDRIPWAWNLYHESTEREARLRYLVGASEDHLFLGGTRMKDQDEVRKNPRAWVEKQLRVFAPELFEPQSA